ncbi:MAG: right-handed parallel beta-helix repeat-containing protein [Kiritimatiellae bacterium]|nr:right-handed parallel beta-helix repeat-containing protein [Kiritimatiellia bacterium]
MNTLGTARICLLVFALPAAVVCRAATYHVSPAGQDERTPQQAASAGTPWRSVAKAAQAAQPGDRVVLLPGVYREGGIVIGNSGTETAPVVFSAQPGAILSGGTRLARWLRLEGEIYRSDPVDMAPFEAAKSYPTILLEGGVFLNQDHGQRVETLKPGSCLWQKQERRWLVWCRAGGDPARREIELPTLGEGIIVGKGVRHLVFEGLDLRHYNVTALRVEKGAGDIVFRNCRFGDSTRKLLQIQGDHIRVERCRFRQSGSTGLQFGGPGAFAGVVRDCVAVQCGNCYYASGGAHDILFERCEASHFARRTIPHFNFKADGDAIGLGVSSNVVVRACVFRDSGWAAYAEDSRLIPWGKDKKPMRPNQGCAFDIWRADAYRIESNVVARCDSGVHIAPGTAGVIVGNTIVGVRGSGISAHGAASCPVKGVVIDGNTVVDCSRGVWLSKVTTDARVVNNILAGNEQALSVQNTEGFFEDRNAFYGTNGGRQIAWLGQTVDLAQYRARSGMGANSLEAGPRFTAPGAGDYRLRADSPCRGRRADGGDLGSGPWRPVPPPAEAGPGGSRQ